MTLALARAIVRTPPHESSWDLMMDAPDAFIWDEHGEQDEDWNRIMGGRAGTFTVHATSDTDHFYTYGGVERRIPFKFERGDDLIAIHTMAGMVRPGAELRGCYDSTHSSTVAFLPLLASEWSALETECGQAAVDRRFCKVDADFDTFFRRFHGFNDPAVPAPEPDADAPPSFAALARKHWLPIAFIGFFLAVLAFGRH